MLPPFIWSFLQTKLSCGPFVNYIAEGHMAQAQRRQSVTVKVGNVRVGSSAPVVVQSMTNTDTADVRSTVQQVAALATAGSELVRVTVNNDAAAAALPAIVEGRAKLGVEGTIV